jgi:hypothetical protein
MATVDLGEKQTEKQRKGTKQIKEHIEYSTFLLIIYDLVQVNSCRIHSRFPMFG